MGEVASVAEKVAWIFEGVPGTTVAVRGPGTGGVVSSRKLALTRSPVSVSASTWSGASLARTRTS
jgi:hypothetical protein